MDVQSKIDALERELSRINYDLEIYRRPLADAKAAYKLVQSKYHEYKALASQEFEAAQTCWNYGDKADAKEHSNRGHELKEKQHMYGADLDRLKSEYESYLNAYNNKKAEKTGIIEQLKSLRAEARRESAERRKAREAEAAHWHDKVCAVCGKTFQYRDNWSHIPDRCKECNAKDPVLTKKCMGCGGEIKYRASWQNIPNYCKICKEKFKSHKGSNEYKLRFDPDTGRNDFFFGTNNPQKWNSHGHAIIDDTGEVHYVRDVSKPHDYDDRQRKTVYNDGVYIGKHAKRGS